LLEAAVVTVGLVVGFAIGEWWVLALAPLWLVVLVDYEIDEVGAAVFVLGAISLTAATLAGGVLLRRSLRRLLRSP